MKAAVIVLGLLGLAGSAVADPTWPSDIDELEEIMYQINSFRSRKFADTVNPCTTEASGPGRRNAAEWLRSAFHDMSTANTFFKTGGLDGSLQYELDNGENTGPGHRTTLKFMAPFVTTRSSLADLLALGVYMSVRSCAGPDGPIIPIRAGRKDAAQAGSPGVPQPQNSAFTFKQQFERMGFTTEEMIQVTACGHTIGGVHQDEFPELMPAKVVNRNVPLDSTDAVFDNKVVTEYLSGNTTNPLVVGTSVKINKNSDFKVFNSDGNKTMSALADTKNFTAACQATLQKMIDVVPSGSTLGDPIVPYTVKPVNLQLTLTNGGNALQLTGYIRVRTTGLAQDAIKNVAFTYKNRYGSPVCGLSSCTIVSTVQGIGKGFDDTFSFYPMQAVIPASTGISAFYVTVFSKDGTAKVYDNNGKGYPLQDDVLFQAPQSCIAGSSGSLTITAAVRNEIASKGASASITYKTPQEKSPVAALNNATVALKKGSCNGRYTMFSAEYTIPGGLPYESRVDVMAGDKADAFKAVTDVGGTCMAFPNAAICEAGEPPVNSTASATVSGSAVVTETVSMTSSKSLIKTLNSTSSSSVASTAVSSSAVLTRGVSTSSSKSPVTTSTASSPSAVSATISGSAILTRGVSTNSTKSPVATSTASPSSAPATISGSAVVTGTVSVSSSKSPITSTSSSTAAGVKPTHRVTVGGFKRVSCWTEGVGIRALSGISFVNDTMTLDRCAAYCSAYVYWGTEYGRECYCSNTLDKSSTEAPAGDCDMVCGGEPGAYCGAGDRLELYSTTSAPTTPTPTATLSHKPTVSPYSLVGCWTEGNGVRALSQASTVSDKMTLEACATFCKSFKYFGTEYGSECYCGSYLAETSKTAPGQDCNMPCSGDAYQYCGGSGGRLELYQNPNITTGNPEQPAAAGNFVLVGCQTEGNATRALSGSLVAQDDMTNEVCAGLCKDYEYFGTEYGRECYCGNALASSSLVAPAAECRMLCAGSNTQYCGAGDRLSVYKKKAAPATGAGGKGKAGKRRVI